MFYGEIKNCDIANGEGVRVSLFVSGCTLHCEGCFNEEAWDFHYGNEFTKEVEDKIIEMLRPSYIDGLTLLGGEPFEKANQAGLVPFLRRVREELPEKNIWAYTGRIYDVDLQPGGCVYCEYTDEMLSVIAVLVDGEFIQAEKQILAFRGSANQRIIDLAKTRRTGELCFLHLASRDIRWHK